MRPWALNEISNMDLATHVEMPGMVSDKQFIKQCLSTAELCLSPEPKSPLNEKSTFIKVAEYMAMGKPIIAFDLPETRWTAQDAGVYISPGDVSGFGQAIINLIDHPEKRTVMGAYARKRFLECLSWDHQRDNLVAAYESLLEEKTWITNANV